MSRRRIIFRYASFICILVVSCISPYEFPPSQTNESIVVQGLITDQPGPYEVFVGRTFSLDEEIVFPRPLLGASVRVEDDQGNSEQLVEKKVGHFFTSTIQGVVGRTYTLTVTTMEDIVYKSTPETLRPVGDFRISYEFKQVEDSIVNLQKTSANGFNVSIDSDILPEQEGRVWWRTTGTYQVVTVPSSREIPGGGPPPSDGSPPPMVPAPPECAGTDFTGPPHPCKCCDCWISEYFQTAIVSDLRFVFNNQIINQPVAFISANRRTLNDKYHLEIEQLSVSQPVYDFWKRVMVQNSNSSSLFQTPFPPTGGNMTATVSGGEPVIGYFAASSIVKKSIEVTKQDVPYHIFAMDIITESCLLAFHGSTNVKPAFW